MAPIWIFHHVFNSPWVTMKVSPHTHPESYLTGSTLASLIDKAKKLGRTHFTYTDNGHLSSMLKAYGLVKKSGLKFIPGIEIYFKDSSCPFVAGTPVERCKYFTGTIYCRDQEAYQALCQVVSRTDFPTIEIYEEKQQLWSWKDLEHMSKFNVDFVAGGIHCMVGKSMLAGRVDIAQEVFKKLHSIFKENFAIAIIAEPWTKKWSNVVEIKYADDTKDVLLTGDTVSTDRVRRMKIMELVNNPNRHSFIKSVSKSGIHKEVNKDIKSVKLHKGFLPLGIDAMKQINKFLIALARKNNVCILVSDYAYYADRDDKVVQTVKLENNKLQPNFYMKNEDEITNYLINELGQDKKVASEIIHNNSIWASRFDNFKLEYNWRLASVDGDPLKKAMEIVKKNGRMQWNNPIWVARLKEELEVIAKNPIKDLTPYFLPICEVMDFYKEQGVLTGVGRGSAAGSLFCYLLGITNVNPFTYNLPFSRFFSLDRIMSGKLPDIDSDLAQREILVGEDGKSGYLYSKYGDKAAQVSTRNTLRLKMAIKDVSRYVHGSVSQEIESLTKNLPSAGQGISDHDFIFGSEVDDAHVPGLLETSEELQKYVNKNPKDWAIVEKALGITRSFGKHAAAFVLSDEPIQNTVPLKDGNITQYEMKQVEAAGLIKYDFLIVHQLKDIQECLKLINKRNSEENTIGHFTHKDKKTYIWDLPKVDEVFKSVWSGNTETLFQINTRSMTPFVKDILPQTIEDIAIIQALVRPGPLDFIDEKTGRSMAEEYVMRRNKQSESHIPILEELIPETYGIFVFQESLTKIARELAGFSGDEAEKLRENMGKKLMSELQKMKPKFIEGASKKVDLETAEEIWFMMETFGRYGFNKSHAISYSYVTYACMFMKHFYPLEWWSAILSNASEKEISGVFWPYVKDMVLPPDINLSTDTMVPDYSNGKIRSKLGIIRGMGEPTIEPIVAGRPYKNIQDFVDKDVAGQSLSHKLIHVGVLDSLFPIGSTLLEKLKKYEDAVEIKTYNDKVETAKKERRKIRAVQPKDGKIPELYLNLHPFKDAAMKKSVLPSMNIDLHSIAVKHSKVLDTKTNIPMAIDVRDGKEYRSRLIDGDRLRRLDEMDGDQVDKDIYVAATCYVVAAKEFSYSGNTKRALKLTLDAGAGYVSEKVLWPDYNTGKLSYPSELEKGSIVTCFMRKRVSKKDMSISKLVIEG